MSTKPHACLAGHSCPHLCRDGHECAYHATGGPTTVGCGDDVYVGFGARTAEPPAHVVTAAQVAAAVRVLRECDGFALRLADKAARDRNAAMADGIRVTLAALGIPCPAKGC